MNYGDIFARIRSNLPGQDKFVSYRFNSNVKDYFVEKGMHVFCTCKFRIERYADSGIEQPIDSCLFVLNLYQGYNSTMKNKSQEMCTNYLLACDLFAYKYIIHVIYFHSQIIISCMPHNNTQRSISHV